MIKTANITDSHILAELAILLWEDHTVAELETDFSKMIRSDSVILLTEYHAN